jgi:biotin carboxylase
MGPESSTFSMRLTVKKILIIGAGYGQLPAIEAARQLGWTSIVVDRNGLAPGMARADLAYEVDIVDIAGVVKLARELGVDGVMTMQSDIGVPTVGAVVDALGLPGVGEMVGRRCSNKIETRRCFAEAGVPQPEFRVVRTLDEAEDAARDLGFPCVVKAPASSGSRGVVKASLIEDVPAAFDEAMRYAPGGELLVEGYVRGRELGAQSFSVGGRCQLVLPHNDTLSKPPYMVPTGHSFPVELDEPAQRKLEQAVAACVEALGIHTGPANIDLIVDETGEAQILEVGARIGATCLPELVRCFTGIDWVRETLRAAVGEAPDLTIQHVQPCAAEILQSQVDGRLLASTVPAELLSHPDVLEVEVTAVPGDMVSRLRKGTDRIGKVLVKGHSAHEAEVLALQVCAQIHFDVEPAGEDSNAS